MWHKIASLCLIILLGSIASPLAAQKTLKGIPAQIRAEGMPFIELNDKTGEQIMIIGAPYEFEKTRLP